MKVPFSWLKEFIEVDLLPHQIEKVLTMLGLEVDGILSSTLGFSNVVVAKVLEVQKHPNADALVIATVNDGQENFQVVCGAPNCRSGIKTAFARAGAVLSQGEKEKFKIKKSTVRGIESHGMLCSARELQIGEDDDGIMEFESHLAEGADVAQMYSDTIFDISITPNLGHCLSIFGVARELAAALDFPLKKPWNQVEVPKESSGVQVQIENSDLCPRYSCCILEGVKVMPSPEWIQKRLIAAGIRPVNNVVDATNYTLLEMGQPMHAFDKDKLKGNTLIVKPAKDGQAFTALDGSVHVLSEGDIAICDGEGIIALGGVMGSEHSKVTDSTSRIVLESACFDPVAIRRTSRRLALMSDSSYRFEKGIDIENTSLALMRTAKLLEEISGGKLVSGITDAYCKKRPQQIIECRLNRINKLLGVQLGSGEMEAIFHRLGMHTRFDPAKESYTVSIPSWRNDLKEEVDLIEEVARLYGYDNIPRQSGSCRFSSLPDTPLFCLEQEVRSRLIREGLQEFITCDLISPQLVQNAVDKNFSSDSLISVLNPCSVDQSVLRPSLLPGMLQAVKYNIDHQNRDIQAFEVGRIHYKDEGHYFDESAAGIILTGYSAPSHWKGRQCEFDFYDLKGIIENFLEGLSIHSAKFVRSALSTLHPGRQSSVFASGCEMGAFGEIHPAVLAYFDISQRVYFAEFNLHNLMKMRTKQTLLKPLSVYPSSERDWTLTVNEQLPVESLLAAARSMQMELLKEISVKDVFQGGKLEAGTKNITLKCVYRDDIKTISQQAVDAEHAKLIQCVISNLN